MPCLHQDFVCGSAALSGSEAHRRKGHRRPRRRGEADEAHRGYLEGQGHLSLVEKGTFRWIGDQSGRKLPEGLVVVDGVGR